MAHVALGVAKLPTRGDEVSKGKNGELFSL
jgi:hypothetical protein